MIDKSELIAWLKGVDKRLRKSMTVIALGGTAMTLLGLKSSTIDVEFCVASEDRKIFENALDKRFKVDIFTDGYIFSEQLPDDYAERSKDVLALKHIQLKVLNPLDIVITKTARLNARDEEDIQAIAAYVDKEELLQRFEKVVPTYSGKEEEYRRNFDYIVERYFQDKK